MNKSALIKIVGILVGSFAVITVATFFLYPYINEDKHEQVQAERGDRLPPEDIEKNSDSDLSANYNDDEASSDEYTAGSDSVLVEDKSPLKMKIDSLIAVNDSLNHELDSTKTSLSNFENALREFGADENQIAQVSSGAEGMEFLVAAQEPKEEFSERVKSLLNLDEEELTPIANQMTQQELVKIYSNSGNIQREKLLRSLSAERAAKLMKEIML